MKFDDILQLFVVKEKKFFPLYIASAKNILEASKLLLEQTKAEDPDHRRSLAHRIKERETEGDSITNRINSELMDAFVTPFDRDDIHNLAEAMDSFLDCIRDSSKKIAIYQPKNTSEKLVEIAEYLVKDASLLVEITERFENIRKDLKGIDELCLKIKEIEHIVDDIYESYMSNLFEKETDAIELVKEKNILQALEDTTDTAKNASSVIRSILVKAS